MQSSEDRTTLLDIIVTVRRRWRLRLALRGLLLVTGALILTVILAGLGLNQAHFTPSAILTVRIVVWVGLLALMIHAIALPLLRQVSDAQVALYVEENEPGLEALLVSAVEGVNGQSLSPRLVDRLVARAVERARIFDTGLPADATGIRRFGGALAVAVAGAVALFLAGPTLVRQAAEVIFVPWSEAAAEAPFAVLVEPGDVSVPKGGDLDVRAQLRGFTSERVTLLFRPTDRQDWDRVGMDASDTLGQFGFRLFDLQEPMEYLVEAGGVSSPVFTISVTDLPYVSNIDLELVYPTYTGLGTERIEHGGDIAAPLGTRVTVFATTTMPVTEGRILIDARDTIPMTPADSGMLAGRIEVTGTAHYRLELRATSGAWVRASLEYRIDPLDDHGPTVSFKAPGRDIRVTAVEEIFAEAVARDDYAIRSLDLIYTVNGGEEQRVTLHPGTAPRRPEVSGGHTFFLEEFDLEPGDLVSYWAQAVEEGPRGPGRTVTSDIYFMQIRPFGLDYRQAEQQGGQQAGGQDSPDGFSERQKQIVAGTFKVQRDRDTAGERQLNEDLATLALSQGRLREQVTNLARRLADRNALTRDSAFGVVQAELEAALPMMQEAEERLGTRKPDEALPPEQKALQHLQRAEAAFREVQVSQGGGGGGGGGGGAANAEELADLFELETDKLRNQYETVERGERQQQQAQEDEAAERLRQLAARQQQENERLQQAVRAMQNRQGQAGGGSGGGGSSAAGGGSASRESQRQLAEQTEELARQLEKLAREQRSDELNQSARQLQEAAQAMRRAAAGGGDGGEAAGERALERIREATRRLENGRTSRLQQEMQNATQQVDRLLDRQQEIARDVKRMTEQGGGDPRQAAQLMERKDSLASAINALEGTLDRLGRDARRDQGDAARRVAEAAGAVRDNRIADKVRFSKGLLRGASAEYANAFENQIASNLEEVRDKLGEAAGSVSESEERRLGRALDRTGDVRRALESLQDRTRAQQGEGQGREGEPGQGQQGQGEGQQGQGQTGGAPGGERAGGNGARFGGGEGARGGALTPEQARQLGREFRAQRLAVDSVRRSLAAEGVDAGELDRVLAGLRALESPDAYRDIEAVERLQRTALEALKNFEFTLRRQVYGDAVGPVAGGTDKVPAGFRDAVAEYYRSLARKEKPAPTPQPKR